MLSKIHNSHKVEFIFEKEGGKLKTDYGLLDGTELWAENCVEIQQSIVSQQVEEHIHLISISFNHPEEDNWEREISIDKREPLKNLKERIATILDIPSSAFKLCRKLVKNEYKDLNQSCDDAGLFDDSAVLILPGTPLSVSQYKLKFMIYNMDKIEPWKFHDFIVVDVSTKIEDVKQMVLTGDLEKIDSNSNLIRLRDKQGGKAGKILQDNKTIKESFSRIYDDLEIAIQIISLSQLGTTYAIEVTPSSIIVEVQRWFPARWEFAEKYEMTLSRDTSVAEFRRFLATKFDLPFEHTLLAKPRPFQLKDVSNIPLLPWEIDDCSTLYGTPLHVQNGDLLIFKDRQEQEKVDIEELIRQKKEAGEAPLPQDQHLWKQKKAPEVAIKITTRYDIDYKGDDAHEKVHESEDQKNKN